ncbi:iron(III) transport system ATP-binding protein [Bacillus sp. OV322]|uniref:ABC transporter ATP-binding protein n=1 Tax=Bacillus sp. OV322 TaxID=1882764 RepID=UPI0008EB452A|nr:ABC transporter ATP-binding protein [Bacillus sp. OV322]SFC51591.1 iron(III) transport system ATP-binding protein [Bacillus sp. OV322]
MASIQIENVQKTFGKVTAIDHLNLDIRDGEFFTFLGPSGCGKTTTLRMIAGFYYPTKGIVRFGEKDMTRVPPEKRNTGMVFQNYALFPHMTVFENVAYGLRVRKTSLKDIKERVGNILQKVRLEKYAERQVSQLSGGQQQRVALARSLVIEPEILLLDEPLSNLDAKLRDEMRSEILRLQREYKITTIYVTHDQAEALSMSDRIAVFHYGVCQQVGTPAEIYNEPANDFVASFIGDINLLPVKEIYRDHGKLEAEVLHETQRFSIHTHHIKSELEGELSLSVRPEAIRILEADHDGLSNVFNGTIEDIQFFGSVINLDVSAAGHRLKINILNNSSSALYKRGEQVLVHIPEDHIRIIPMVKDDAL